MPLNIEYTDAGTIGQQNHHLDCRRVFSSPLARDEPRRAFSSPLSPSRIGIYTSRNLREIEYSPSPRCGGGSGWGGRLSIDVPTPIPAFPHRGGRSLILRLLAQIP